MPLRRLEGRERGNDLHLYMLSYPSSDCRRVDERNGISKGLGVNKMNILMQEICFADWVLSELSFKIKNVNFKVLEFLYNFTGVFRFDVDI